MSNDIIYISIACRICQCDAGNHGSSEAQGSKIGHIHHDTADGTADTSADDGIAVAQVYTEQSRFCDAEENRYEAGNTQLSGPGIPPVSGQITQNGAALGDDCH